jgi:hypothetical protein
MKFQVYAYEAFFKGTRLDHVYVKFDNGETFRCAGGDSGGEPLDDASGDEDFELASKFNKPMEIPIPFDYLIGTKTFYLPTGDTGVIYGINGVCHNMANRIMFPTRATVHKARGYPLSLLLFDVYGTKVPWKYIEAFVRALPFPIRKLIEWMGLLSFWRKLEDGIKREWEKRCRELGIKSDVLLEESMSKDYKALLEEALDGNITEEEVLKIMALVNDHESLLYSTSDEKMSYVDIINDVNMQNNIYLKKIHNILGDERYEKLFNIKVGEELNLFNPEEFEASMTDISNSLMKQLEQMEKEDNLSNITAASQYANLKIDCLGNNKYYLVIKHRKIDPDDKTEIKGFEDGKLESGNQGEISCRGNSYTMYGVNGSIEFEIFENEKSKGSFTWDFDSPYWGENKSSLNKNSQEFMISLDDNGNAGSRDGALGTVIVSVQKRSF